MSELINLGSFGEAEQSIEYKISEDGNSITIDAVDEAMDPVQDFIREKLLKYGCDKKPLLQIRLAVEEIFVNIISYAYRPDVGKAEIRCDVAEEPLTVTIQFMDSGKPFDPLKVEAADTSGEMFLEKPGGFGIHLVKNTMDDVDYEYKDGKNILRIKKNLT
ncbi:MAG: ATP-binding protein [Eubacterium sp.]|nr:ATP-binding protein [Eubacterium sp.]